MDFLIAETVCRIEILDSNYKIDTYKVESDFRLGFFHIAFAPLQLPIWITVTSLSKSHE
jgi:hypothetical protein